MTLRNLLPLIVLLSLALLWRSGQAWANCPPGGVLVIDGIVIPCALIVTGSPNNVTNDPGYQQLVADPSVFNRVIDKEQTSTRTKYPDHGTEPDYNGHTINPTPGTIFNNIVSNLINGSRRELEYRFPGCQEWTDADGTLHNTSELITCTDCVVSCLANKNLKITQGNSVQKLELEIEGFRIGVPYSDDLPGLNGLQILPDSRYRYTLSRNRVGVIARYRVETQSSLQCTKTGTIWACDTCDSPFGKIPCSCGFKDICTAWGLAWSPVVDDFIYIGFENIITQFEGDLVRAVNGKLQVINSQPTNRTQGDLAIGTQGFTTYTFLTVIDIFTRPRIEKVVNDLFRATAQKYILQMEEEINKALEKLPL